MAERSRSDTIQLKTRMKEPLRAKLEAAAKESGITLNAEVVRRIESSFEAEKRESLIASQAAGGVYASFGGMAEFMVMRLLANAISTIEQTAGGKWREDPALFAEVKRASGLILNFFKPRDEGQPSMSLETIALGAVASESEHLGDKVAVEVMNEWLDRTRLATAVAGPARRKKHKRR